MKQFYWTVQLLVCSLSLSSRQNEVPPDFDDWKDLKTFFSSLSHHLSTLFYFGSLGAYLQIKSVVSTRMKSIRQETLEIERPFWSTERQVCEKRKVNPSRDDDVLCVSSSSVLLSRFEKQCKHASQLKCV